MLAFTIALALAATPAPTGLTGVRDSYPALSPDGARLVFHSNRTGRQAVWIARADGAEPRILFDDPAQGTDPGTPAWSPDGRTIAFAMRPAGAADENESDIYFIAADGGPVRRMTNAPGDDSHPRWSASGRLFFNSARATPDLAAPWNRQWIDIYSMQADGSGLRRHTDCRSVCTYPAPSPDGRRVAYRRVIDGPGRNWDFSAGTRNSEVFVSALAGGGEAVNVSRHEAFDGWPIWSPDGRWIVFASGREGALTGQLYAVHPDGSALRRLTEGPLSRAQPNFSADGSRLVFNQNSEGAAFEFGHIATMPFAPD